MVTKAQVEEALRNCYDPELRMDIVTLGLVYGITIQKGNVTVRMTFTSPMCPYGKELVNDVKMCVGSVKGVTETTVDIVFDPPWEPSAELKATLGIG